MQDLPREMLAKVLSGLHPRDACNFLRTCREIARIQPDEVRCQIINSSIGNLTCRSVSDRLPLTETINYELQWKFVITYSRCSLQEKEGEVFRNYVSIHIRPASERRGWREEYVYIPYDTFISGRWFLYTNYKAHTSFHILIGFGDSIYSMVYKRVDKQTFNMLTSALDSDSRVIFKHPLFRPLYVHPSPIGVVLTDLYGNQVTVNVTGDHVIVDQK